MSIDKKLENKEGYGWQGPSNAFSKLMEEELNAVQDMKKESNEKSA